MSLWQIRNDAPHLVFCDSTPESLLEMIGITVRELPDPEPTPPDPVEVAKMERNAAVEQIRVEVDGLTFDGNETAQRRMANALIAWPVEQETAKWVLADNTVAAVTKTQLQKALELAVAEMGNIWVGVYDSAEEVENAG